MSFAIHLFIDAWPAGWMKAIMDVDRVPKKAWFTYRDALAPVMVNLRTDRYNFFTAEDIYIEAWLCNDLNVVPKDNTLKWQLEKKGKVISSSKSVPQFPLNSSKFQGYIKFNAPKVSKRSLYNLRLALFDENGLGISESVIDLEVFPKINPNKDMNIFVPNSEGKSATLLTELNVKYNSDYNNSDVILIDDIGFYKKNKEEIDVLVEEGKTVVFLELPAGKFKIGDNEIVIEKTIMGQYYFVSPTTNHSIVKNAEPFDFKFWYDDSKELVSPLLASMIKVDGSSSDIILKTGKTTWKDIAGEYAAASEIKKGKGVYRICQLQLNNRTKSNPTAKRFAVRLITKSENKK